MNDVMLCLVAGSIRRYCEAMGGKERLGGYVGGCQRVAVVVSGVEFVATAWSWYEGHFCTGVDRRGL